MEIIAISRDGKETLKLDPAREPGHPKSVVLNGRDVGRDLRRGHLKALLYLMNHQNVPLSYRQIAVDVWDSGEQAAETHFGTMRTTIGQLRRKIGKHWIRHEPNVSFEFLTFIHAELPANACHLTRDINDFHVEVAGSVVASLWVPPFRQPPLPSARNKEISLLLAKTAITELIGRDDLWHDTLAWCNDSTMDPVSIFCIKGRGGSGKTRFCLELVHHLRTMENWDARFVRFEKNDPFDLWTATVGARDVLLVFDYAPDHAAAIAASLRLMAENLFERPTRRLRVLLLARSASLDSGWLNQFRAISTLEFGRAPIDFFRSDKPIVELNPLKPEDRIQIFREAYRAGAFQLQLPELPLDDDSLQNPRADQVLNDPLTLILAALVGLRNGVPHALSLNRLELVQEAMRLLVDQRLRAAFPDNAALALHIAAYSTLASGLSLPEALSAIRSESETYNMGSVHDPTGFVERLAAWFPGGDDHVIGAIEPDILGEAFVIDQLSPKQAMAKDTILRIANTRAKLVVQFLIRAAQDFGLVESGSREEPIRWLDILVKQKRTGRFESLLEILDSLPELSVVLRPVALSLTNAILDLALRRERANRRGARIRAAWLSELFKVFTALAITQSAMGEAEAALASAENGVRIGEILAKHNPELFKEELVIAINHLGVMQREFGDSLSARRNLQYAAELYRGIADHKSDRSVARFAMILRNLSAAENDSGHSNEALGHADEAINLVLGLFRQDPEAFVADYAVSLSNLGGLQLEAGQSEASLITSIQAVAQYRTLVATNRDAFLPFLAAALSNLAAAKAKAGQPEEAWEHVVEAVKYHRELVTRNRSAFLPEFLPSLTNLGMIQRDMGDNVASLVTLQEAVELSKELSQIAPDRFLPALAAALNALFGIQFSLRMSDEAFATLKECCTMAPEGAGFDMFGFALACLGIGHLFIEQDRHEDAIQASLFGLKSFLLVAQADRSKQNIELVYSLFDMYMKSNKTCGLEETSDETAVRAFSFLESVIEEHK
jgi:tetratricopeptide (TPR) repeat protein